MQKHTPVPVLDSTRGPPVFNFTWQGGGGPELSPPDWCSGFGLVMAALSTDPEANDWEADAGEAAIHLPLYTSSFTVPFPRFSGRTIHLITCYAYVPPTHDANTTTLFVMHGAGRNCKTYFMQWLPWAVGTKSVLIVPWFCEESFPGSYG